MSCNILVEKLDAYGLHGWMLDWIKNCLDGQAQSVMVNRVKFSQQLVTSDVQQRSVLRSVLVNIFILWMRDQMHPQYVCRLYQSLRNGLTKILVQKHAKSVWQMKWFKFKQRFWKNTKDGLCFSRKYRINWVLSLVLKHIIFKERNKIAHILTYTCIFKKCFNLKWKKKKRRGNI